MFCQMFCKLNIYLQPDIYFQIYIAKNMTPPVFLRQNKIFKKHSIILSTQDALNAPISKTSSEFKTNYSKLYNKK